MPYRKPNLNAKHCSRRAGFTLVEMLIVIAIIGLLAAILFPVFGKVREAGRKTVCASNLAQLGKAFMLYTQDYGRRYPGAGNYYPGFVGIQDWTRGGNWVGGHTAASLLSNEPTISAPDTQPTPSGSPNVADVQGGGLYPYTKSAAIYVCPSNAFGETTGLTYSMNCALHRINEVRITSPSEIVLLVDEKYSNDGYFYAVHDGGTGSPDPDSGANTPSGSTDALTQIHNGGGNLLFCDGHVKFYVSSAFIIDGSPTGLDDKWTDKGIPRFHDRALGKLGSNGDASQPTDYCNAKKRGTATWP